MAGREIVVSAQADAGKTAAFAMPILQLLKRQTPDHKEIRTLILTPTQELAIQIEENFKIYSKYLPLSLLSIYEGVSIGSKLAALRKRVDVLVATPGGLLNVENQRHIDLSKIELFVLDDADKMLDMGFTNHIKKIVNLVSHRRQNLIFSATMPGSLKYFAKTILNNPVEIITDPVSSIPQTVKCLDLKNIQSLAGSTIPVRIS